MKCILLYPVIAIFLIASVWGQRAGSSMGQQNPAGGGPPVEWIDPDTGHRVIRLSSDPGSTSFYFHQNGYTADGDRLVFSTRTGLATIDLKTRKIEPLVEGRVSHVVVGKKTRQVFYLKDGAVYATNIDTRETREIVRMPELRSGSGLTVNADETLLAGSFVKGGAGPAPLSPTPATTATPPPPPPLPANPAPGMPVNRESSLETRWAARLPMTLYTIRIKTGETKFFHDSTDWLNHVQFSTTDPGLLMFCHEGPWHKLDRIWTIRTDGSGLTKIHTRTMEMEIAGHEFWSPDGRIIWYDLQTPKSKVFWLAGHVLATGEKIKYKVEREHWSVHYNVSPDGKLFAGDGGGPNSVAAPGNGQWIYLFTPQQGALKVEKLVNLAKHDYRLEPNVTFTPDAKWIVFRSNLHGASHVYAVEVKRRQQTP